MRNWILPIIVGLFITCGCAPNAKKEAEWEMKWIPPVEAQSTPYTVFDRGGVCVYVSGAGSTTHVFALPKKETRNPSTGDFGC